jgi:N-methylhydantoinase A
VAARKTSAKIPARAIRRKRRIYWPDLKRHVTTPVLDGDRLVAGNRLKGPAIVETADTTVVVHPGTTLRLDRLGNFELTFN